ncbi:MAG: carbonic anhydrase, partial [Oceanobacter sp.]
GVRHIIICGHTNCGAVSGALDIQSIKAAGLPHVREWLDHCRSAMEIVRERHGIAWNEPVDKCHLDEAIQENVLQQVAHLRTHPAVAAKLATGKVMVHGWVYDIKTGQIDCSDDSCRDFVPFQQRYAEDIAALD